eukprot:580409-Lingulodinium_polyedra.AAC.1
MCLLRRGIVRRAAGVRVGPRAVRGQPGRGSCGGYLITPAFFKGDKACVKLRGGLGSFWRAR